VTAPAEHPWLLGFFTGRLHLTVDESVTLVFHGIPLSWSVCGVPVVTNTAGARGPHCPACVNHVRRISPAAEHPPSDQARSAAVTSRLSNSDSSPRSPARNRGPVPRIRSVKVPCHTTSVPPSALGATLNSAR
jgi:hypothetical protein